MKDSRYGTMINIITSVRDFDSFTSKTVQSTTGLSPTFSRALLAELHQIKAISIAGKRANEPFYQVSDNAIQIIKSQTVIDNSGIQNSVKGRKEINDFPCRAVTVDKADVSGMGNSFLKLFDSLLTGVRT
ncbi:hypothetical protein [Providencia heimbachae]|uniref:hypothetical protein n=1 Tax=Providencia heimbachae TaxID=333962 RepID=UPI000839A55F